MCGDLHAQSTADRGVLEVVRSFFRLGFLSAGCRSVLISPVLFCADIFDRFQMVTAVAAILLVFSGRILWSTALLSCGS